jgi:hypothetical protein
MKRALHTLVIVVTLVLVLAIPTFATPPSPVSGEIYGIGLVGGFPTFTPAGNGNACFIEGTFVYEWTGEISGTSVAHVEIISHGPCFREDGTPYPKGTFRENLKFRGTFEGTVNGSEWGTFAYIEQLQFAPIAGGMPEVPNYEGWGQGTIRGGTDGLAGLHGVLTFAGGRIDGVEGGTYEGDIHFDPSH